MDQKTKELIENEIGNNEVCLFMKGTPDDPQCGFSMAISNILKILEVKFKGINILENEKINIIITDDKRLKLQKKIFVNKNFIVNEIIREIKILDKFSPFFILWAIFK